MTSRVSKEIELRLPEILWLAISLAMVSLELLVHLYHAVYIIERISLNVLVLTSTMQAIRPMVYPAVFLIYIKKTHFI